MPQALNPKLVERAVRGDQAALCQLLQTHQHRLYNVVLRMIGHRDDAAEVTQDTLLKIIEHIGGFKSRSDITTWMTRIAMNTAFSHLRKQRLRRTVSLDHAATDPIGRVGRDQLSPLRDQLSDRREPNPALCVQQEEQQQQLLTALARLQARLALEAVVPHLGRLQRRDDVPDIIDSLKPKNATLMSGSSLLSHSSSVSKCPTPSEIRLSE